MDNYEWLLSQIKTLEQADDDYINQAFYVALSDLVKEQATRLEQAQGELDGRMWSTGKW